MPQAGGVAVSIASFPVARSAKASDMPAPPAFPGGARATVHNTTQSEGLVKTLPRDNTTSQISLAGTDGGTDTMAQRFDFQQGAADLASHF